MGLSLSLRGRILQSVLCRSVLGLGELLWVRVRVPLWLWLSDLDRLSVRLGLPVQPLSALPSAGVQQAAAASALRAGASSPPRPVAPASRSHSVPSPPALASPTPPTIRLPL